MTAVQMLVVRCNAATGKIASGNVHQKRKMMGVGRKRLCLVQNIGKDTGVLGIGKDGGHDNGGVGQILPKCCDGIQKIKIAHGGIASFEYTKMVTAQMQRLDRQR